MAWTRQRCGMLRSLPLLLAAVLGGCAGDGAGIPGAVRTLDGRSVALLPADSSIVIVFTTAECPLSRLLIHRYDEARHHFRQRGLAFRLVVSSDVAVTARFARRLETPGLVIPDGGGKLARAAGATGIPTMRASRIGEHGLARWYPLPLKASDFREQVGAVERYLVE